MKTSTQERKKAIPPLDLIRIVQRSETIRMDDSPLLSPTESDEAKKARMDLLFLEASQSECISSFSRLMSAIGIETGQKCDINCRSWRCPRHRLRWGMRTASILSWQLERTPCDLLLNLTTSEPGFTWREIRLALQQFWRDFRAWFGPTKYAKIVEAAKKNHGQVHFHILVICPGLAEIMTNPPANWPKKLSWPTPLFEQIKYMWSEALAYAAPQRKQTDVVWCQPPREGKAAAFYAVGYITGTHKDEEPDHTWSGRKFTYSNSFFEKPTEEIWRLCLIEKYGPQEKITFFWQPKADLSLASLTKVRDSKRRFTTLEGDKLRLAYTYTDSEKLPLYQNMAIVKERKALADYYQHFGYFPTGQKSDLREYAFEVSKDGQSFDAMRL